MYFLLHTHDERYDVDLPIVINTAHIVTVEPSPTTGQAIITLAADKRIAVIEDFEHLLSILDVPHI